MIASDPYLMEFVEKFTEINDGSAYFADLNNLGSMILKDYSKIKLKNTKMEYSKINSTVSLKSRDGYQNQLKMS